MTQKDLGPPAVGNTEVVTLGFLDGLWPGHSTRIQTDQDTVIPLPLHPVDTQMELFEICATTDILVSVPDGVLLTAASVGGTGVLPGFLLPQDKTAFLGFRFSTNASAWFYLSFAVQA